jgi:hypothetical protein
MAKFGPKKNIIVAKNSSILTIFIHLNPFSSTFRAFIHHPDELASGYVLVMPSGRKTKNHRKNTASNHAESHQSLPCPESGRQQQQQQRPPIPLIRASEPQSVRASERDSNGDHGPNLNSTHERCPSQAQVLTNLLFSSPPFPRQPLFPSIPKTTISLSLSLSRPIFTHLIRVLKIPGQGTRTTLCNSLLLFRIWVLRFLGSKREP